MEPISKNRLEAFSDGVIAIIITIMVLELRPPAESSIIALRPLFPTLLSYILSFVYLAIYWNNHHHMLHAAKHINGSIMWANLHLLFWLSLFPFVTAWAGKTNGASWPIAFYGFIFLMAALSYTILQRSIIALEGQNSPIAKVFGHAWKEKLSPVCYALAIGFAFRWPQISVGLYVLVALFWIIPDKRIEKNAQ